MSTALVSAAEISNLISVFTVLLALIVMVIFILRLQGEEMFNSPLVRPVLPPPQPLPMVAVQNPFVLRLEKPSECTLQDVHCTISSQVPVVLQAFWGVPVNNLHKLITASWPVLKSLFMENSFLADSAVCKGDRIDLPECSNHELHVQPPIELGMDELGSPPRTKYPLVIVMIKVEEDECNVQQNVTAMVNVIHIRDSVCNMESCILMQYLKQKTGQVACLQPLYVTNDSSPNQSECPTEDGTDQENSSICVVCQSEAVTRALLPCRHACICAICFSQVDKCPMCRARIHSYFCIKDESIAIQNSTDNREDLNWKQKLEHLALRVSYYFGFT